MASNPTQTTQPAGAGPDRDTLVFLGVIAALTVVRLIGQHFSMVDLDVEEAQYWDWSRHLAFGYFSKPPLIAWVNAVSGLACGSSAECLRAPAALFYGGTSILVFLTTRTLYDTRAALWAGLICAFAPGVSFSARIMTTDVPLLFFWALALYAYVKLMRGGGWRWGAVLAVAFGLGLLAKYAMAYFIVGVLFAGLVSRDARQLLKRPLLWLALLAGLLMLTPNILWNADNGFATAGATADYVHKALSIEEPLDFFAAQFGVAGPITFGMLLVLLAYFGSRNLNGDDRAMLAFAVPPLLIILLNGIYSGAANANWAAPALISTFVVTSAFLVRARFWRMLGLSLGIGVVAQAVLLTGDTLADRLTIPFLGQEGDVYERVMGWEDLADNVTTLAESLRCRLGRHRPALGRGGAQLLSAQRVPRLHLDVEHAAHQPLREDLHADGGRGGAHPFRHPMRRRRTVRRPLRFGRRSRSLQGRHRADVGARLPRLPAVRGARAARHPAPLSVDRRLSRRTTGPKAWCRRRASRAR